MLQKHTICAIVLTFNRKEKLKKCIECILNQKNAECDILIVDNGSVDGTQELINSMQKSHEMHYFNTGKNLGSAGGFSFGIDKVISLGYEYLWIMDDDVFPDENALHELLQADSRLEGNWGCLSSYAYWKDGATCKANRPKKSIFRFVRDDELTEPLVSAKIVSFASMFVKSDVVLKVGLPIADYFIYTDDYEFSSRISDYYPTYVVSNSKVLHYMNSNHKTNVVRDSRDRLYRYRYLYRNDIHFYKKFGIKGIVYILLKFVYSIVSILFCEKDCKLEKIKIVLSGISDGIYFRPNISFPNIENNNDE